MRETEGKISLRRVREAAGVTQKEIAAGLGYSELSGRTTVSQIEIRKDWHASRVKKYVEAAGGTVHLHVDFPDGQELEFEL